MTTTASPRRPSVTCGVLFEQCLRHFLGMTSNPLKIYGAAFAAGQAEKIYIGACHAAMFRPSSDNRAWMLEVAGFLCETYNLNVSKFDRPEILDEIWIHSVRCSHVLTSCMKYEEVNSPSWHSIRGWLCGVPMDKVDIEFHNRRGYGQPCDIVKGEGCR